MDFGRCARGQQRLELRAVLFPLGCDVKAYCFGIRESSLEAKVIISDTSEISRSLEETCVCASKHKSRYTSRNTFKMMCTSCVQSIKFGLSSRLCPPKP